MTIDFHIRKGRLVLIVKNFCRLSESKNVGRTGIVCHGSIFFMLVRGERLRNFFLPHLRSDSIVAVLVLPLVATTPVSSTANFVILHGVPMPGSIGTRILDSPAASNRAVLVDLPHLPPFLISHSKKSR